ncbi:preprotein translocase subunit SecE [Candidatus Beckwithbacteria bacterium CG10_big_fil_rev_8_21_14_0_10_34_10]|uniref:Protein translocase subunit SecE n=1 Tax=Candidatus Beckwithbacteria bacterium CG10_big_fil_rev_8_21_14_0_10_34_10 TaxID=1974495 RepID=A0A2H0W8A6_9BACT|nr:MAG: preprotein translocase subunit SecE [Candidatus Beckwithbacteria bacterium CG10_big_fil_rev_8_21_14_0_10_34_10]
MIQYFLMDMPNVSMPKLSGSPIKYLIEVKAELRRVKWPTKNEVIKMTSLVILVSTALSLFISSLDFIFTKLTENLVKLR